MLYSLRYSLLIPLGDETDTKQKKALAEVLANLMFATGVYRLFTEEDYHEFLKRFHLVTRSCNFINNYFIDDHPNLYVIYKGDILTLGVPDLQKGVGLICGTSPRKNIPFEDWLKDIQWYVNDSILSALGRGIIFFIGEIEIDKENSNGFESNVINFKNGMRVVDADDLKNAEILADSILKDFNDDLFQFWRNKYPNAEENHNVLAEKHSVHDHFAYWKIAKDNFQNIERHFRSVIKPQDYDAILVRELTHLAWAYKNEYVFESYDGIKITDEFVWLDTAILDKFEPRSDLDTIYEKYQLQNIFKWV